MSRKITVDLILSDNEYDLIVKEVEKQNKRNPDLPEPYTIDNEIMYLISSAVASEYNAVIWYDKEESE